MRVYVIKSGKEYELSIPDPDPNAKQAMSIIREVIEILDIPKEEVEEYILSWSEEIKTKK